MNTKAFWATSLMALLLCGTAAAQKPACPGWNNPNNFTATYPNPWTGTPRNCWSGQTGEALDQIPNVYTSTTGISLSNSYSGNSLTTATYPGYGGALPSTSNQFYINTTNGNDPNVGGSSLKYIPSAQFNFAGIAGLIEPTNLTRSIRIGDGNSGGQAAALYYELTPSVDNAIFILYYALVAEAPGHGLGPDPAMIIRVMEKVDPANQNSAWRQISDTLAYYITSTPTSQGGNVVIGQGGWHHGITTSSIWYKEWEKVIINLSDRLNMPTRIEIMARDCEWQGHFTYAYIAGDCQSANINVKGCPPGASTEVATLGVPRGMKRYTWSASNYGRSVDNTQSLAPGGANSYFTFRQLQTATDADSGYIYHIQADDFRIPYRPNSEQVPNIAATPDADGGDSIGNWQTFRCELVSAIDPTKEFSSYIYTTVNNIKPTMKVDTLPSCDGNLTIWNQSFVPQDPNKIDFTRSSFSFYNNPSGGGTPEAVYHGDSATHTFTQFNSPMSVLVRTYNVDTTCYSESLYPVRPIRRPAVGFTISDDSPCDGETVTLTDTTQGVQYRKWTFLDNTNPNDPNPQTIVVEGNSATENRTQSRLFVHNPDPIELYVRNNNYYTDSNETHDTIWCDATYRDTVKVFVNPKLNVTGDTIVCAGKKTNAKVEVEGMDNCTYQWSTTYGRIEGNIPAGDSLVVEPYADEATYYVLVTNNESGCQAWSSINTYVVRPRMTVDHDSVCPGHEVVLMGHDAAYYTWTASPADSSLPDTAATIVRVHPTQSTVYTMVGHGSDSCDATPISKPVVVLPLPEPKVELTPNYIDVDEPTTILRDISTYGVATNWLFEDGASAVGREVQHTFEDVVNKPAVGVQMTTYNALGCEVVYPFTMPVKMFTAWFPTAFTPNSNDDNAKFSLHSINEYEEFHIYIYDRTGRLMFQSNDPNFEWDGTRDGEPCMQGSYAYICHFRKPGTPTLNSIKGTITLIR